MIFKILIASIVLINSFNVFAQNDSIFGKEITVGDYKLFLMNNNNNVFTGSLQISDKYNNSVFYVDSFYTRYNWDTLVDLNNDGSQELILDIGTGATMYDYNMFLIFDFSKDSIEPFEIHNAELITYLDQVPKIVSNIRMSPSALGASYSFSLEFNNNKFILENDLNRSNVLKSLEKKDSEYLELIEEYRKVFNECGEDSDIKTYYESYIMQQKILGQEDKGWQFFDKYYNCKDKEKIKIELKKNVQDSYDLWKSSEFKLDRQGN